jgi:thiol-disulfide isomerase/thioredoxin
MKKLLFIVILCLFTYAYSLATPLSIINGQWNGAQVGQSIKLLKTEQGVIKEIASSVLDENYKFNFAFISEKEGFYNIEYSLASVTYNHTFYFKPGDVLGVEVTNETYVLTGENTPENLELARWYEFILPIKEEAVYFFNKNSTFVDFFPLFEGKLTEFSSYKPQYTQNKVFTEKFQSYQKFDVLFNAILFVMSPRSAHPQSKDYPAYYREINIPELTQTAALLEYPFCHIILNSLFYVKNLVNGVPISRPSTTIESDLSYIANDTLKGEFVIIRSTSVRTYEGIEEYLQKYGKYLITDSQKQRMTVKETELANQVAAGQKAIDFQFPDLEGKAISLSDFKGKVVYVDLWATWCVYCIKEFPALKQLEEAYSSNSDLIFLSVSVDASKDKQKWADFVRKEDLKGIQLFAGDAANSALMKPYHVTGIPRFILIGKDGNLILGNAPRPSSDEIRTVLDAALK